MSLAPTVQDFGRFADGGPDGSWYIGFNNAWIVELPPASTNDFARAFIGAKIGRAKTRPKPGNAWEREVIPGKVYIGISGTPSFTSEQSYFLADTSDIPLEPDPKVYAPGSGQSQWFWAEVPIGNVNSAGPNYLILWSPTEQFTDAAGAPIVAAAETRGNGGGPPHAWVNRSIQGVPPRRPAGALAAPIGNIYPALAVKLIPPNTMKVIVHDCSAQPVNKHASFSFSVIGQDVELTWLEASRDQLDWERKSRFLRNPPYLFNLLPEMIPSDGIYLRAAAQDQLGNKGFCPPVFVSGAHDGFQ